MRAATKIMFFDDSGQKFLGEGPYRLLLAVEETGSLRAAAFSMEMAYSKALELIRNAEAALGFPLTMRAAGGGSILTPQGKEWLRKYGAYRDACVQTNRELYLEFFPEQR